MNPTTTVFLTVSEAASRLRISTMSLYRRINEGRFPAIKIGGRYAVVAAAVEEMAADAVRERRVVNAADYVPSP